MRKVLAKKCQLTQFWYFFEYRLFIGYMDFMGAVLIGIMSFFSTRSILFDISFFFRSISRINSGAKVIGGAIWFNLQWWMYMVVWAAFLDIGRVFILIYIIFLDKYIHISYSSFEQIIRIPNFDNYFLLIYFLSIGCP